MAARPTSSNSTTSPKVRPESRESVRETADSIVVAFILAFVFRAFIIEAFVIPTGSMAATLYGEHLTVICADCGWEFAHNVPVPSGAVATCPNCAHRNKVAVADLRGKSPESGDRILALKWPYDIGGGFLGPQRWDVTLFKDPSDSNLADGVTNFIKRLAGKPNEVLEIIDGDVYTAPVEQLSERTRKALDDARHAKYLRRNSETFRDPVASSTESRLRAVWPDVLEELNDKLRICRKTRLAQESLWGVVYDHDFPPRRVGPGQPYWAKVDPATTGWNPAGRRLVFSATDDQPEGVALRGKKATDVVGYNVVDGGEVSGVTDLRQRFVCTRSAGEGTLLVRLPQRQRSFWAELNSDGTVRLYETTGGLPRDGVEPLAEAKLPPLAIGEPFSVDFRNVDHRVSLRVAGEVCLSHEFVPDIAALRKLTPELDPGEIGLFARGMSVILTHVVVERDVYYRSRNRPPTRRQGFLSGLNGRVWGGLDNPILLREGEYFMLGDNSPASGDSRVWSVVGEHLADRGEDFQLGTVPADQLIGRAFFVYWPSGHRPSVWPLDRLGIVPNVGRMRWIR